MVQAAWQIEQLLPGRREEDTSLVAQEELRAELLLQGPDLRAQWCLRHVHAFGHSHEVQFFGDGDEVANMSNVHAHTIWILMAIQK